ncbi:hypothetical protein ACQKCJ_22090 [Flavobacterium sp. NPDC079362]|uniref:hypothetical protein n=1 Tax=Flavobacterium sp. NPDC079362 TaxID=3390566 RepID=UPI003D05CA07
MDKTDVNGQYYKFINRLMKLDDEKSKRIMKFDSRDCLLCCKPLKEAEYLLTQPHGQLFEQDVSVELSHQMNKVKVPFVVGYNL